MVFDGNYYSVPYQLVQEQVEVRSMPSTVEIFHKGKRIASHLRSRGNGQAVTNAEHPAPQPSRTSAGRLARQLLTEALLISAMGGAAGLGTAGLLLQVIDRWQPAAEAHLAAGVGGRVYLAGLVFTLGSALLFGMFPAREAWRSSPIQTIKGGPSEPSILRGFAVRDLLLGVQIAICTLLVTASLVAARGMVSALHAPLGFQPTGAMLADIDLTQNGESRDGMLRKQKELIDAMLHMPASPRPVR